MPFSRKEMLVSSAFLGIFKNTWRLHSISVLYCRKEQLLTVKAGFFKPRLALSPEDIMMVSVSLHQKADGF